MTISLNKPAKGTLNWNVPLVENCDELMAKAAEKGEILAGDIKGSEFNVANKLLKLDADAKAPLAQIPRPLGKVGASDELLLIGTYQLVPCAHYTTSQTSYITRVYANYFDFTPRFTALTGTSLVYKFAAVIGNEGINVHTGSAILEDIGEDFIATSEISFAPFDQDSMQLKISGDITAYILNNHTYAVYVKTNDGANNAILNGAWVYAYMKL